MGRRENGDSDMKKAVFWGAAACLLALTIAPATAQVSFRGSLIVTAVDKCLARYVGETFSSAFVPAKVGGNPDIASLTHLNTFSADVYELDGSNFEVGKWKAVRGNGMDVRHYSFPARIKILNQSPARISSRTNFVALTGMIENMGNEPGLRGTCVVTFRGAYFRRVP